MKYRIASTSIGLALLISSRATRAQDHVSMVLDGADFVRQGTRSLGAGANGATLGSPALIDERVSSSRFVAGHLYGGGGGSVVGVGVASPAFYGRLALRATVVASDVGRLPVSGPSSGLLYNTQSEAAFLEASLRVGPVPEPLSLRLGLMLGYVGMDAVRYRQGVDLSFTSGMDAVPVGAGAILQASKRWAIAGRTQLTVARIQDDFALSGSLHTVRKAEFGVGVLYLPGDNFLVTAGYSRFFQTSISATMASYSLGVELDGVVPGLGIPGQLRAGVRDTTLTYGAGMTVGRALIEVAVLQNVLPFTIVGATRWPVPASTSVLASIVFRYDG